MVVEAAGKPEVHLMLVDPARDPTLQRAIRTNRVMTLHQAARGADYGVIGFAKGVRGQILLFPRSLKPFAGIRVMGIKYDLLKSGSPAGRAKKAPATFAADHRRSPGKTRAKKGGPSPEPPAEGKIVKFPIPHLSTAEENEEDQLKTQVRQALRMLEQGRWVAATNLLRRIAGR
jgi:hypothetical protein